MISDDEAHALRGLFTRLIDPAAVPVPAGPIHLFEDVARRWYAHMLPRWTDRHATEVLVTLERDVFPTLGQMALSAITPPLVLETMRAIEKRGSVETARRVRQRVSMVFCHAIAEGIADSDPAALVSKAMQPAPPQRHHPALLELDDACALFDAIGDVRCSAVLKLASGFLALTAVRAACVRLANWSEIEGLDGPDPIWRVPAAHMKLAAVKKKNAANCHVVPLSRQAVSILRAAAKLEANDGSLVFPGVGESALGSVCKRAGYAGRHVPHGWRATFSTVMNERYPEYRAAIDLALAHAPKDKVEAAYNRSAHLERRREVFQRWADLLFPDQS